jgi:hypothetical protein
MRRLNNFNGNAIVAPMDECSALSTGYLMQLMRLQVSPVDTVLPVKNPTS